MREGGLERAIEAAGGVSALARAIGVSQPTVSNWERVPAERTLAVEAATGVSRSVLRPDLYPPEPDAPLDEVEAARAAQYRLLSALFASDPKGALLAQVARLRGDASPLGMANAALAQAAAAARADEVEAEYFDLFIGVGRGETMPFGSYYLAGFVYDRPLQRLRADLARIGVERSSHGDPEDHIAFVLEAMAGMIDGTFEASAQTQRDFFERHVASWAPRFLADLMVTPRAGFYRPVAQAAAVFLDIETQAYRLDDATAPAELLHEPQASSAAPAREM